jgi:hypothetical protein
VDRYSLFGIYNSGQNFNNHSFGDSFENVTPN